MEVQHLYHSDISSDFSFLCTFHVCLNIKNLIISPVMSYSFIFFLLLYTHSRSIVTGYFIHYLSGLILFEVMWIFMYSSLNFLLRYSIYWKLWQTMRSLFIVHLHLYLHMQFASLLWYCRGHICTHSWTTSILPFISSVVYLHFMWLEETVF